MADASQTPAVPRLAATVILFRDRPKGAEVLLLRRNRGASFMSDAFVFPGGKIDEGETPEEAAARELFEEAGVLLTTPRLGQPDTDALRVRATAGAPLRDLLAEASLTL